MNKNDICNMLREKNIWYKITEHKAVYNMQELSELDLPYPDCNAKNIFVRDDKKENFYLITIKPNKRVDLKKFKKENNTRHLTFASEEELKDVLNLTPGSVTPFGLLNDSKNKVILYLDQDFINEKNIIGIHPNDNTATIWIKINDLISIIEEHGNKVNIIYL